ncbi:ABC transporter ATP-binding protein [Bifidobacterium bifidum]|nr:ABC transporter ATP-binding protein [Bifidobacterium bifidum]
MAYIEFDKVVKEYPSGGTSIRALDEASFTADQGELTVILGQSGAGKTTALNILGGMDTATSGRVVVGERDITGLRKRDLITYRRNDVGFGIPVL